MAQRNFVAWRYTTKKGSVFARRADSRLVAQQGNNNPLGAVGGSAAAGLTPYEKMPRNIRPRVAICAEEGTDFAARVVIYTPAAYTALAAQTGTATFQVYDAGGTAHTCLVTDVVDEAPSRTIKP